jgi:16S rRNA processing protein RimM
MTVQEGVKAGKISKPYGLQGEVHILIIPVAAQKLKPGIPLFIDMDGQRVPYFIESVELIAPEQAIVKVEFINSVEEARKIVGQEVFLDPRDSDDNIVMSIAPGQLTGYLAIDLNLGEVGVIADHIPNEMNPVWVIRNKSGSILIPATEDFIKSIDHEKNILLLNLPEGITEL